MATEVQGSTINLYFRDFGTSQVWRKMTCEETMTFDMTNNVNKSTTKCGVFKGLEVSDFKVSGTGVCNFAPTSTEYSHDLLTADQQNIQKKEFRIQDAATLGTVILLAGGGYFTASQISFPANDVVKYTFTFEGVGVVEQHES